MPCGGQCVECACPVPDRPKEGYAAILSLPNTTRSRHVYLTALADQSRYTATYCFTVGRQRRDHIADAKNTTVEIIA